MKQLNFIRILYNYGIHKKGFQHIHRKIISFHFEKFITL